MNDKKYIQIARHYESCLEKHGDNHLGVDWPNLEDLEKRYRVMLDIVKYHNSDNGNTSLLDFGCGASHLYEYILKNQINNIVYSGLDISDKFISLSQKKFPSNSYYLLDVLDPDAKLPFFDYIIMNGVFTEKRALTFDEMFTYFKEVLMHLFQKARIGIAFNVMSKHVDWERDDLFHLPFDVQAGFLTKELSRNFIFRNDYDLYECTTYVFKIK